MGKSISEKELRKILIDRGMNYETLSARANINYHTLKEKLHGRYNFTFSEVCKICRVLGIENPIGVFDERETKNKEVKSE